jgi:hypothetical protein
LNITREDAQALLQIIGRAKFEGNEVMSVAQLIQKLGTIADPPKQEQPPVPLKKKD